MKARADHRQLALALSCLLALACVHESPVRTPTRPTATGTTGGAAGVHPSVAVYATRVFPPREALRRGERPASKPTGISILAPIAYGDAEPSFGTTLSVPVFRQAAERCATDLGVTTGDLRVAVSVSPDGEVGRVESRPSGVPLAFASCVEAAIKRFSYVPPAGGGATPVYIFTVRE